MARTIAAIAAVYLVAVAGWITLAGTISNRTYQQNIELKREVGQLWGTPLEQLAPKASLKIERHAESSNWDPVQRKTVVAPIVAVDTYELPLVQSDINIGLKLDQRQKGLLWYSTYGIRFDANYTFENSYDQDGTLTLNFSFPAADGLYDDFKFEIDGKPVPFVRQNKSVLAATTACAAKSRHYLAVTYSSQGMDRFTYHFGDGISEVRGFKLIATTDFDGYDHPANTMSPNVEKERVGRGWKLTWNYSDLITGNGIGIEMPQRINPGPMAARISYFAPVSLGFFFFLIFVISLLRGVRIHPVNYFFLASAFFAFHLLLAYLVDHISIHSAFFICSAVSIFLVVSYMRLVVGSRFAYLETGLSQFVYLIGFSYAFFVEGFTGLTVAIGSIITLFVIMQATARIDWAQRFSLERANANLVEPRST